LVYLIGHLPRICIVLLEHLGDALDRARQRSRRRTKAADVSPIRHELALIRSRQQAA